jgi:tRNA-specific 2-thiouridylase
MQKSNRDNKVVLGLSGGVDSAVAAYLLKKSGYDVFCVFLKNWTEPDENGVCTAVKDREDAIRVAAKLDLPFMTVDHEKEYRERVFAPFVRGLNDGVNPNPDVLCNPLVKFSALLGVANRLDAAHIATGHYARHIATARGKADSGDALAVGLDKEKDQSYFLSRITREQLARVIFPLGEMTKSEVRAIAAQAGLHVAQKEGTSGICFIGERNFENFMKDKVKAEPGRVIGPNGEVLGEHRGLPFYTIGQRHGFGYADKAGSEPYYVAKKDFLRNELVVARSYDEALLKNVITATDAHWINPPRETPFSVKARLRYRQPLVSATVDACRGKTVTVSFSEPQRAVTPGQYIAFYDGEICLGSAVIARDDGGEAGLMN